MDGAASVIIEVIKSSPRLVRMFASLGWMYFTLGMRVRRTRRAFERELVKQGLSRENAKHLSFCFEELEKSITGMVRRGISFGIS